MADMDEFRKEAGLLYFLAKKNPEFNLIYYSIVLVSPDSKSTHNLLHVDMDDLRYFRPIQQCIKKL